MIKTLKPDAPVLLLMLMAIATPISFATWSTLLNNFVIDKAAFNGADIGLVQSVREIPGLLAFSAVFILLFLKEQRFALISLVVLGIGTALTGYFPSLIGICITTTIMSFGFHYYETMQTSLSLQWLDKSTAAHTLGQIMSVGSLVSVVIYALLWLATKVFSLEYEFIYMVAGLITVAIAIFCWIKFPLMPEKDIQHKNMVLRKRYWLYYALTFMSGARRQIFVVFAGFLMVERFGYSVAQISSLYLINAVLNIYLAPQIGRLIIKIGERRALLCEYSGLIVVFSAYAFVESPLFAAVLYLLDHLFFAMAIALKTYFQKIADPKDIASTAAVGFTINHIAAVFLPVMLGLVWLQSPKWVFLIGACFALISLLLSILVPRHPQPMHETILKSKAPVTGQ